MFFIVEADFANHFDLLYDISQYNQLKHLYTVLYILSVLFSCLCDYLHDIKFDYANFGSYSLVQSVKNWGVLLRITKQLSGKDVDEQLDWWNLIQREGKKLTFINATMIFSSSSWQYKILTYQEFWLIPEARLTSSLKELSNEWEWTFPWSSRVHNSMRSFSSYYHLRLKFSTQNNQNNIG